ncbi:hypothetical protein L9G74_17565 [Shewanella sp. C32]|uniref:DUF998 domain-containing protein n=1 Tax=Shewanella electrica TaxID=515560 RepID=A0ABT2FPI0_9GAMM|nr:hypothetical protein [Shewanella electrica]MCH1926630.1 hypothetical protein [Shewanella electrica]MCS4558251.1 hypothetical protein [Shewanella electrica]
MSAYEPFHQRDLTRFAYYFAVIGVAIAVLGIFVSVFAAFHFHGIDAINMRIDKLGDYLSSPMAFVFNISLLLCGGFFALAMSVLIGQKYSVSTNILALFGIITGAGLVVAGLYPFNELRPHQIGELIYVSGSILVFSMLLLNLFRCRTLCGPITGALSFCGLVAGLWLMLHVNSVDLNYHPCSRFYCALYPVMWLHSFMAILVALSMGSTVLRLGLTREITMPEL